jgi:anti-anti-sigma factor
MENLTFGGERRGDWWVLAVGGTVDLATSPQLKAHIAALIDDAQRFIVVDLTGVPFIDSTGLGALVTAMNTIKSSFGRLRVVASSLQTLTVLDITGLLSVLDVFDTVEAAVMKDGESSPRRTFDRLTPH